MSNRLQDKRIFISYGHDIFAPVAERLANDLCNYAKDVWFDTKSIRSNAWNWAAEIEQGIESCDIVLALMTKHSHRTPSGICTNEIIFASNKQKEIRPILVEHMEIPLLLCAIQYFDIQDVFDSVTKTIREEQYRERFLQLVAELQEEQTDFKGYLHNIKAYLQPQDNRMDISRRAFNFVGREWLIEICTKWIDSADSNFLFILGQPGCGKTSFLSKLLLSCSSIKGIHYCRYNDKNAVQIKSIIKTISYHLITQVPEYAEVFGDIDIQSLTDKNEEQFFATLITNPLSHILHQDSPVVIAVDAIDEMSYNDRNALIQILSANRKHLPDWLKLIITSRSEYGMASQLKSFNPVVLDVGCAENRKDLQSLIDMHEVGKTLSSAEKELLIAKSDGIIQYVKLTLDELVPGERLSVEQLPGGMFGIFQKDFVRFTTIIPFEQLRVFLNVLCAFKEPAPLDHLKAICGDQLVSLALKAFGSYIILDGQRLSLFHKSLFDWLTNSIENTEFSISLAEGNALICQWIKENAYQWQDIPYISQHGIMHYYDSNDLSQMTALLAEPNTAICDSFIELLCHLLCNIRDNSRWILSVLREIVKKDLSCDYISCHSIKAFIQHSNGDDGIEILCYSLHPKYPWISDYIDCCRKRHIGKFREIICSCQKLLETIDNKLFRFELYDYLGDAYRIIGDHENAFYYYKLVLDDVPKFLRAEKSFASLYNYLDLRYVKGFVTEAETEILYYSEMVRNDFIKQYKAHRLLGNIRFQKGMTEDALSAMRRTYELAKMSGRQYYIAEALYSMAECMTASDPDTCLELVEESRRIFQHFHYDHGYAKTFFASVERLIALEKWQEAITEGEEGIRWLTNTGYLTGVARINRNLAVALLQQKQYSAALERAMSSLLRYKERNSYPIARLKNYLTILRAAKEIGKLEDYQDCDNISLIPNLSEFPNSAALVDQIYRIKETIR